MHSCQRQQRIAVLFLSVLMLATHATVLVQAQTVTKDLLATRVYGKSASACAILYDGSLKCWGSNLAGQLGQGDQTARGGTASTAGNSLLPVNLGTGYTVKSMCENLGNHRCVILNNGKVKCWGLNTYGQLGLGLSTVEKIGDDPNEMGDNLNFVSLGTNTSTGTEYTAKQIACGNEFTCALLSNDKVKCWGRGSRLGLEITSTTDYRGDGANEMGNNLPFVNLGTNVNVKNIHAGFNFACAHLSDNSVKCWGANINGELGIGSTSSRGTTVGSMGANLPAINFGTGRSVTKMALGLYSGCAILDNNVLKCWGSAVDETLANEGSVTGDIGNEMSDMGDNWPAVNLGTGQTPVDIFMGVYSACARLQNNNVKCWGLCEYKGFPGCDGATDGVIGNEPGEMGDALLPMDFGTNRYAKHISIGDGYLCSTLDNNYVKCWGLSFESGQLLNADESSTTYTNGPATVPYANLGTIECSPTSTSVACKQCPTPTFWLASSSSCTSCPVGGYYVDLQTSCTACSSGTQSVADYYAVDGTYPANTCSLTAAGGGASGSYNFVVGATQCYACLPGSFAPVSASASCTVCPVGYYQTDTAQDSCDACPAGTYNPSTGATSINNCTLCPKGTYSGETEQNSSATCALCPEGYFNFFTGKTNVSQCFACPAGTHSVADRSTCVPCEFGKYSTSSASAQCTAADAGYRTVANTDYWSPSCPAGDTACISNSPDKFQLGPISQIQCSAGTFSSGTTDTCTACQAGYYLATSGTTSDTCQPCAAATYSGSTGTVQCTACGAGYYGTSTGSTTFNQACTACQAGTYSSVSIATSCQPCGAGRWGNETARISRDQCHLCPAGTYNNQSIITDSSQCAKCGTGYFSSEQGAESINTCQGCPPGTYSSVEGITTADQCTRCVAGTYSTLWNQSASSTCLECPNGTYSQAIGASSPGTCDPCGLGNYSDVAGATKCKQCVKGTYSTASRSNTSGTCTPCRKGTWSDTVGASSSSYCIECGLGTYSETEGAIAVTTCLSCGKGKYGNYTGAGSEILCHRCPVGTFLDTEGNDNILDCTKCPPGTFNNALGSQNYTACNACDPGYHASQQQTETCVACPAGYSTTAY